MYNQNQLPSDSKDWLHLGPNGVKHVVNTIASSPGESRMYGSPGGNVLQSMRNQAISPKAMQQAATPMAAIEIPRLASPITPEQSYAANFASQPSQQEIASQSALSPLFSGGQSGIVTPMSVMGLQQSQQPLGVQPGNLNPPSSSKTIA